MRLLFINQFYPPDVAPTGVYLHDLAKSLAKRGHAIKVLCSRNSYDGTQSFAPREVRDGVEVRRLFATGLGRKNFVGKMSDYATFYTSLAGAVTLDKFKPDLILSLTTPPYAGVLARFAAWTRRCGHAHWIMDLYPDVMASHGMTSNKSLLYRFLQQMTKAQLRNAKLVLALGPRMAERVSLYAPAVQWAPLWSDPSLGPAAPEAVDALRAERRWANRETIFLYSGNMGLGHRFGEFLAAAAHLGSSGPRWVFSGGGKRRSEVESFAKSHPGANIEMLGYVPAAKLRAHLCSADVHLVSLDANWQGTIVPSKLQGSFAVGRPVLYVGGTKCETAEWIMQSGGGWVVEQNDEVALLEAVKQASDRAECARRGEAALNFARARFHMNATCDMIANMLERCG